MIRRTGGEAPVRAVAGLLCWLRRGLGTLLRRCLAGLCALTFFAACSLILFKDSFLNDRIFWQADTVMFYYPISVGVDSLLQEGRLPLWTPYIFGGHPLLADGEAGMFYPFNLLLWWLLPAQDAFIVLRIVRFTLAAFFMYGFARALRQSQIASMTAGLVFGFGSFMIGQLHHANLGTSALWLPLILRYVELSIRLAGRRRLLCIVLAGMALGFQTLTIHVNPLLMSGVVVGGYVLFRCLVGPVGGGARVAESARLGLAGLWRRLTDSVVAAGRRMALALGILGGVGALGFGMGAVQLLPLFELAQHSPRYGGVDYRFATSFALPPANLLTLIFPYFFRNVLGEYWSPWFRWNTTLYVGIMTLALVLIAITLVRTRITFFFATLAAAGLLLAMGDYLPIKPYSTLWQAPLFSMTRVPARYTYWVVLAAAVLSAQGMDWLRRTLAPRTEARSLWTLLRWRGRRAVAHYLAAVRRLGLDATAWRDQADSLAVAVGESLPVRLSHAAKAAGRLLVQPERLLSLALGGAGRLSFLTGGRAARPFLALLACLFILVGGLALGLRYASWWVETNPSETMRLMNQLYPRDRLNPVLDQPAGDHLSALRTSLSEQSVWTRNGLLWMVLSAGLLAGWYRLRVLARSWQTMLVLLLAADLLTFGRAFHPQLKRQDLAPRSAAVQFLIDRRGLDRVFVAWPVTTLGPNRLLPYGIADAGGYSSLMTQRYSEYMGFLQQSPNQFFDMMGVRYVVVTHQSDSRQISGAHKVYDDGYLSVYERDGRLGRAYVAGEAGVAPTRRDALRIMSDPSFDPQRGIVLDAPPPKTARGRVQQVTPNSSWPADVARRPVEGSAQIEHYTSERVRIRARAQRDAYLVLTDTYFPGWTALVDGQPAPIMQANVLFRAVPLPEGEHTVEFVYRPQSVAWGALISLFTGGVFVLCAVVYALWRVSGAERPRRRRLQPQAQPAPGWA